MNVFNQTITPLRFSEDLRLLNMIQSDERIATHLRRLGALENRWSTRSRLLSHAVRVDVRLVPRIALAVEQVRAKTELQGPLEAYLYDHPSVQAAVMRGRSQTLVLLSSGAVNRLDDRELEFVIGHELGHAIFDHLEVAAAHLIESESVDPRSCLKLRAWQRAAEISADRCGLICCGDLTVAATALFKSLCGLDLPDLRIDPQAFAEQWEHLANEVIEVGGLQDLHLTHPFPPLRVKAMMAFWDSVSYAEAPDQGFTMREQANTDQRITSLLAMLDPLSRESKESADPILEDFYLWGGLYIAMANGDFHESEQARLATMVSSTKLSRATQSELPDREVCLRRFRESAANRQRKISAVELHRILQGLLQVANSDGSVDAPESRALKELAEVLGVGAKACDLLVANMMHER